MPFESPDWNLGELLDDVSKGKVQLPDFQREWKWDEPRITSLLTTITLGYPMGVVMTLETGADGLRFKPKPISGVHLDKVVPPEQLLLDGQQRLTSLYQALMSEEPVDTIDSRGKRLRRWYYIDIQRSIEPEDDREEAILSIPEDRIVRDNFGRDVIADYSRPELECASGVFPLSVVFDSDATLEWAWDYAGQDSRRKQMWKAFKRIVLDNVTAYLVPVIKLTKNTPKDAVCTVFEKVNTGGIALNVFELLTATFAGEQWYYETHGDDFRLNEDWRKIQRRLSRHRVLSSVESTDLLQIVALLTTWSQRARYLSEGGDLSQAPGVSCKRKDILKLTLEDYLRWSPIAVDALEWAATFLAQEHVFRSDDLPYRTQLVPLAAVRSLLSSKTNVHAIDAKLRRWYWSGVLGELYGGSTETRFARDVEQLMDWMDGGHEPGTVAEASFRQQRLLTLRTRNSAAYKGIYALLMRSGCVDWIYNQPLNLATYYDYAVDIHHVFPKAWCQKMGVDTGRSESIVNKTALSAATNRRIGGKSPTDYCRTLEKESGLSSENLDSLIETHHIDARCLRAADFSAFFTARAEELLTLIGAAMGKGAIRTVEAPNVDDPADFEQEAADVGDESPPTSTTPLLEDQPRHQQENASETEPYRPADSPKEVAGAFHQAMVEVYRRALQEAGYRPTRFIQMVEDEGGVEAARRLLHAETVSDGFTALWERHRLDLAVEAVVLRPEFASLFSDGELRLARDRLRDYGYAAVE